MNDGHFKFTIISGFIQKVSTNGCRDCRSDSWRYYCIYDGDIN